MSKKALRKYLRSLNKDQLEEQLLDLYDRFRDVKTYYNFVFDPQEDKLMEEFRFRVHKEYFPPSRRKPKARRSVAQRSIRHFIALGMEPYLVADAMLFNLETAQEFSAQRTVRQEAFYISMLRSFREARDYIRDQNLEMHFRDRLRKVAETAWEQEWFNRGAFELG
jgi:hypothetical protein